MLLLLGAPLLAGVLTYLRAVKREEPFAAFAFGLGATWAGSIALAIVIGLLGDAFSLRGIESPKYYATPFMALAAVGLGLVAGLVAGTCAALVVRARVRRQTQSMLRATERTDAAQGQRYSPYFPDEHGEHTDA